MKGKTSFVLIALLLFVARMEGGAPGHFGGGRSSQFGSHGQSGFAAGARGGGHFRSSFRPGVVGGQNFGGRHSGAFYRHQFFSPGFFAPYYWSSGYDTLIVEKELLLPVLQKDLQLYYRKAPALDMNTNCKDAWTGSHPPNSVGQVMKRMFELQCENGHSSPDAELRHPGSGTIEEGNSVAPP